MERACLQKECPCGSLFGKSFTECGLQCNLFPCLRMAQVIRDIYLLFRKQEREMALGSLSVWKLGPTEALHSLLLILAPSSGEEKYQPHCSFGPQKPLSHYPIRSPVPCCGSPLLSSYLLLCVSRSLKSPRFLISLARSLVPRYCPFYCSPKPPSWQ